MFDREKDTLYNFEVMFDRLKETFKAFLKYHLNNLQ